MSVQGMREIKERERERERGKRGEEGERRNLMDFDEGKFGPNVRE